MKAYQWNKVNLVIAGATLALIALILLQGKWLLHSKNLIEEQFNQKVSMALCMAITELGDGPKGCIANPPTSIPTFLPAREVDSFTTPKRDLNQTVVEDALDNSLAFYDIHTPYHIEFFDKKNTSYNENASGCCSLESVTGFNNQFLKVTFPYRTQYVLGQMWFMLSSSILILLFVSTIFWLATHYLIEQRKVGERNKDFFNNMAHEFKTPLTNIILATNLLAKKEQQVGSKPFVKIVKKESNKLLHQIERVLYLANMEKAEYQLNKEALNVNEIIQEVINDMTIQIQAKQADISIVIPKDLVMIGDKFHLSNAFRNIIDNALKYSNESPKLLITSKEEPNGILLLFEDNGIGISKSNQSVVFDTFQRAGTGDIHNEKGFGLGLAYVKKVVELHEGFIKIFSELNKGSRFDLFLPIQ